jgi:hypothetical protein
VIIAPGSTRRCYSCPKVNSFDADEVSQCPRVAYESCGDSTRLVRRGFGCHPGEGPSTRITWPAWSAYVPKQ